MGICILNLEYFNSIANNTRETKFMHIFFLMIEQQQSGTSGTPSRQQAKTSLNNSSEACFSQLLINSYLILSIIIYHANLQKKLLGQE